MTSIGIFIMDMILLWIMMKRIRNSITAEIQEEQCGIVAGKGTTYAVFMLRTLAERARLKHIKIVKMLKDINTDGKRGESLWEYAGNKSSCQRLGRGANRTVLEDKGWQGCVLSPDFFLLYRENKEIYRGQHAGNSNEVSIVNLRYTYKTVLIVRSEKELRLLLNTVIEESEKKELNLKLIKKTVVMSSQKPRPFPPPPLTHTPKVYYTGKRHKIKLS